jgi:hypothetical protein
MDEGIRIPGTHIRIGLDPIIGLVPGIGDMAGALLSGAIVVEAMRQGISRFGIVRMAANIALDTVIGAVPILGDLFDAGWKANRRNIELLERHLGEPHASRKGDRVFVILVGGALLVLSLAAVIVAVLLSSKLLGWLWTEL